MRHVYSFFHALALWLIAVRKETQSPNYPLNHPFAVTVGRAIGLLIVFAFISVLAYYALRYVVGPNLRQMMLEFYKEKDRVRISNAARRYEEAHAPRLPSVAFYEPRPQPPPHTYQIEIYHRATLQSHEQINVTVYLHYTVSRYVLNVASVSPHLIAATASAISYWAAGLHSAGRAISQPSYQKLADSLTRMKGNSFAVSWASVKDVQVLEQPVSQHTRDKQPDAYQYINNMFNVSELNIFLDECPQTHPEIWSDLEQREALQIEVKRKIRGLLNPEGF